MVNGDLANKQVMELIVDPRDYRRWQRMASVLGLNVSEYIRRCTSAHTTILEHDNFNLVPGPEEIPEDNDNAGVAQQVEQLTCNQQVAGSIPVASSIDFISLDKIVEAFLLIVKG